MSTENINSNEQLTDLPKDLSGKELLAMLDNGEFENLINEGNQKNEIINIADGLITMQFDEQGQLLINKDSAIKLGLDEGWPSRNLNYNDGSNLVKNEKNFNVITEKLKEVLSSDIYKEFGEKSKDIKTGLNYSENLSTYIDYSFDNNGTKEKEINGQLISEIEKSILSVPQGLTDSMIQHYYNKHNADTPEEKLVALIHVASISFQSKNQINEFQNNISGLNLDKDFFSKVQETFRGNELNTNFDIPKSEIKQALSFLGGFAKRVIHNTNEVVFKRPNQDRNII